jgi:hypothetical protein
MENNARRVFLALSRHIDDKSRRCFPCKWCIFQSLKIHMAFHMRDGRTKRPYATPLIRISGATRRAVLL